MGRFLWCKTLKKNENNNNNNKKINNPIFKGNDYYFRVITLSDFFAPHLKRGMLKKRKCGLLCPCHYNGGFLLPMLQIVSR